MRTLKIFFICCLSLLLFQFYSCDNTGESSTNDVDTEKSNIQWCTTTCEKGANGRYLEITPECDSCWQQNFAAANYQFTKVPDSTGTRVHLRGVKVDILELYELLESVLEKRDHNESVALYAMFGIVFDPVEGQVEPKLIFQVEGLPKDASRRPLELTAESDDSYYDFTNPCPTYCPK